MAITKSLALALTVTMLLALAAMGFADKTEELAASGAGKPAAVGEGSDHSSSNGQGSDSGTQETGEAAGHGEATGAGH